MQKIFKNLDEQINILRDKGLIIDDEEKARDIILRENYFFLSGYRHLFLQNPKLHRFKEGVTFHEFYSLFYFDRQLRNIIFKNILIIENNLKSIFSYQLSKNYGYKENDYLRPSNFNQSREKYKQVADLLKKIKRQIRINGSQNSATTHYIYNYGYVPLWIVVKVLSFGIVCELFSVMKYNDQKEISEILNIPINDLISYLPILANYRNLCAHEDILYNHKTATLIDETIYHKKLYGDDCQKTTLGKNDLFALIIVLKRLLREQDFRFLIKEIEYEVDALDGKLKSIKVESVLHEMGFPANYSDIIDL